MGAQRNAISKNDLPSLTADIVEYLNSRSSNSLDTKSKEEIADDGVFSLSYRQKISTSLDSDFPLVTLGDLCDLYQPKTITQKDLIEDGEFVVFGANGIIGRYDQFNHENPEVIVTCRGNTCGTINMSKPFSWITGNAMVCSPKERSKLSKDFLFYCLKNSDLSSVITGSAQPQITRSSIEKFSIPLPPLEVQQQIVDELEGYQKIIDGCRQVVENYKPTIDIDPSWEMVELSEVCSLQNGYAFSSKDMHEEQKEENLPVIKIGNVGRDGITNSDCKFHSFTERLKTFLLEENDLVVAMTGATVGKVSSIPNGQFLFNQRVGKFVVNNDSFDGDFIKLCVLSDRFYSYCQSTAAGGAQGNISGEQILQFSIPKIDSDRQKELVKQQIIIQSVVDGNKRLIEIYTQKIQDRISKVWGE